MIAGHVAKVPRPRFMRGHLINNIKMNIVLAFITATANASAWWYFVCWQRKQNYDKFYESYDAYKDFERMKKLGVFQSVK